MILGYTAPQRAKELRKYDLTQTLLDYRYAQLLNRQGCRVKVHLKMDTGMHRLGFDPGRPNRKRGHFDRPGRSERNHSPRVGGSRRKHQQRAFKLDGTASADRPEGITRILFFLCGDR